ADFVQFFAANGDDLVFVQLFFNLGILVSHDNSLINKIKKCRLPALQKMDVFYADLRHLTIAKRFILCLQKKIQTCIIEMYILFDIHQN
ncbi:hypothetical protein, partial [Kingella denitrificans]